MEEADRRKLLKLEARLSMAEGERQRARPAVLEEIVKLDPLDGEALHAARPALLAPERARPRDPLLRARREHRGLRGRRPRSATRRCSWAWAATPTPLPLLRRAQEIKPRDDVARYLEQVERLARAKGRTESR